MARTQTFQTTVITGGVLAILALLLLALWPFSISARRDELMVRHRLRRLGIAVTEWVIDHGCSRYPPIVNPPPRTLWQPGRANAAAVILRPYLSGYDDHFRPQRVGDMRIPSRRQADETEDEYHARLRAREITVDPRTGFAFWYNAFELRASQPQDLALGITGLGPSPLDDEDRLLYFSSQTNATGEPPHRQSGEAGWWGTFGYVVHRPVAAQEVTELRTQLNAIEEANVGKPASEWTHDLVYLREEVSRYEEALARHPTGFTVHKLASEVRFVPGLPPR